MTNLILEHSFNSNMSSPPGLWAEPPARKPTERRHRWAFSKADMAMPGQALQMVKVRQTSCHAGRVANTWTEKENMAPMSAPRGLSLKSSRSSHLWYKDPLVTEH